MTETNSEMSEHSGIKRSIDCSCDSDSEDGDDSKSSVIKRRKLKDEFAEKHDSKPLFNSPEKSLSQDEVSIEFKTPEKVTTYQKLKVQEEITPIKDQRNTQQNSPSGWSLSSDLSLCIEGDEEDLISKVEQARRLMSSANSSPDKSRSTPKKISASSLPSSNGCLLSPKTPSKGRRVPFITLASPKSKKT